MSNQAGNHSISYYGGKEDTIKGRRVNEDKVIDFSIEKKGKIYKFGIILDGATGLGETPKVEMKESTLAEWYVNQLTQQLKKDFQKDPTIELQEELTLAIREMKEKIKKLQNENNIQLEDYQEPSAGIAMIRADKENTDICLLGDLDILIGANNGKFMKMQNLNGDCLKALDQKVIDRMVKLAEEQNISCQEARKLPEIEEMLIVNREKKNTEKKGAYWVAGTQEEASKHAVCVRIETNKIKNIIAKTDGIDLDMIKTVSEEIKTEEDLYKFITERPSRMEFVIENLKEASENDETLDKSPRFKKRDDATILSFNPNILKKEKEKNIWER